ncbi:hypothetical protein FA13DRAFT_1704364 [Coprinellus micaceus]|uniref:Uncharacterized protein n=1 Tax=Coprinellus micaceus TaxID=71717 RepID=A0A4Y7TWP8_COPMI|nr:hypothetical protein FA13DRAFT_1704364 [Coprinellus micaceus]
MPPVQSSQYVPSQRKSYLALPLKKPILPASQRRWPMLSPIDQMSLAAVHEISSAKIPKPPGEVGRPGRGGYALKVALNWPEGRYKEAQEACRQYARSKLEIAKPFTQQESEAIKSVCASMVARFPEMKRYADKWPASDFIKGVLRNAVRYRPQEGKTSPQEGRDADEE